MHGVPTIWADYRLKHRSYHPCYMITSEGKETPRAIMWEKRQQELLLEQCIPRFDKYSRCQKSWHARSNWRNENVCRYCCSNYPYNKCELARTDKRLKNPISSPTTVADFLLANCRKTIKAQRLVFKRFQPFLTVKIPQCCLLRRGKIRIRARIPSSLEDPNVCIY